MISISEEQLQQKVTEIAKELFGQDFCFREHQLETTTKIVQNVWFEKKHQIMNAPTGSGKSITAIVAAEVLWKLFQKKSYILVSDLSLFDQYVNDIKKFNIKDIGWLKGKDNYVCMRNHNKVNCADCALEGTTINQLLNGKFGSIFPCRKMCSWVNDYQRAVDSPITLMTYQLYFIQRNYVEAMLGQNKSFPMRDLVVCDEAHKICDIIQTHFSPIVDMQRPRWMDILDEYATRNNLSSRSEQQRQNIIYGFQNIRNDNDVVDSIEQYENYLSTYCNLNESVRAEASSPQKRRKLSRFLKAGNQAREAHCKFDDILKFLGSGGKVEHIVINPDSKQIALNYIHEDQMLRKYFHEKSGCELLMSATIGDFKTYVEMTGIDESKAFFYDIPATFDYSNSPIVVSFENRMAWSDKARSLPVICNQIVKICESHGQCKGIIQTGNYENSRALSESMPRSIKDRMIFYENSKNKKDALTSFHHSKNGILVGPTLLEGLNFPGDECRFSICMKLPYASLGNELVKRKKDLIQDWYVYDVINKLEQGFGRGIRFNGDWCINYILDGCIAALLRNASFSEGTAKRFRKLTI